MTTSHYPSVPLRGKVTIEKMNAILQKIQELSEEHKTIGIRFSTNGGNMGAFRNAKRVLEKLTGKGITIIGEAEVVGSAGLLMYILCTHQLIKIGGHGFIHLPEPIKKDVSERTIRMMQKESIDLIKEKTNLSEEEILNLNNLPMGSAELIQHGIAKEKVHSFTSNIVLINT